jgi:quercetin dioxygenase-like cupin family protein
MGLVRQTLAGEKQGLKTMEIWLVTMPPGSETPVDRHCSEVVGMMLKWIGRAIVEGDSIELVPDTTLVMLAQATRQVVNIGEEDLVILAIRSLARPPEKTMMKVMSNFLW